MKKGDFVVPKIKCSIQLYQGFALKSSQTQEAFSELLLALEKKFKDNQEWGYECKKNQQNQKSEFVTIYRKKKLALDTKSSHLSDDQNSSQTHTLNFTYQTSSNNKQEETLDDNDNNNNNNNQKKEALGEPITITNVHFAHKDLKWTHCLDQYLFKLR